MQFRAILISFTLLLLATIHLMAESGGIVYSSVEHSTIFIEDIYKAVGLERVPRGEIKSLRLHACEYGYVEQSSSSDSWHTAQSGWDIKREIGCVDVEKDGSVLFKVPASTPIYIQLLDDEGAVIRWMRDWVAGNPDEVVSCVGSYERSSQVAVGERVEALRKGAKELQIPDGGVHSFTFDLAIQPILDRACISCHDGVRRAFNLRRGSKDKLGFAESYLNLIPYVHRQVGSAGEFTELDAYEYHPSTSELVRMLKKGHYNTQLLDEEWRTLYQWIGYNAPDMGYFSCDERGQVLFTPSLNKSRYATATNIKRVYADGEGIDWRAETDAYKEYLKGKGEITPERPKAAKAVKVKDINVDGWPFSSAQAKSKQKGRERMEIEVAEGVNIGFVWIPAGEFVMGSYNGDADAAPTSKVKIKNGFWMAELEITNEQVRALIPTHDSKYVDQQCKDHVVPGYQANSPEQPATRISYLSVMEYCELLKAKTGLNITLPTEAQWEWAARAGSDSDFWYGNLNSDFGDKENLADKTTLDFAVIGVDPSPMSPTHALYSYYTYLPKEAGVDDGNLVMVGGKGYAPNPFGLYNIHGDVAEWTRSDYLPYPYKEKSRESSEYKVVRGGSYYERPKFSTSHTRKYYYPYQSVYNVGFRLIIEE